MAKLAAVKGGNLFIRSVDVPSQMAAGEDYDVTLEVVNGADFIWGHDADSCETPSKGASPGYEYAAQAGFGMALRTGLGCIGHRGGGQVVIEETVSVEAPSEPGQHEFVAQITARGSASRDRWTATVDVVSADGGGDGEPADDPGGGVGGDPADGDPADSPGGSEPPASDPPECPDGFERQDGVCVPVDDDGGGDGGDDSLVPDVGTDSILIGVAVIGAALIFVRGGGRGE
jgi:hypothetical protein